MIDERVVKDMRISQDRFKRIVEPVLKQLLATGGDIQVVEGRDDEICRMLDMTCGIDAFYKDNDKVWGVASRIQGIKHGNAPFNSFTVRVERESGAKTELEKRMDAIRLNGVRPNIVFHAYIDKETEELLSMAIAREDDVTILANKQGDKCDRPVCEEGRCAVLRPVFWRDMRKKNKWIRIWTKGEIYEHIPESGQTFKYN